jgi:hypothetical protein
LQSRLSQFAPVRPLRWFEVCLPVCETQDVGRLQNKVLLNLNRSSLQRHNYPLYCHVIYAAYQRGGDMATADIGNSGFISGGKLERWKGMESE